MTDTSILLTRLRKSRQSTVKIGEYTFTVRRPTAFEAANLFQNNPTQFEIARDFVDNWDGVKDKDLVPSGGSDAVEFDRVLWGEWLADMVEFWEPIFDHVVESFTAYKERKDTAGKV